MENEEPTALPGVDELRKLTRWALVAFAARCARRVQPLFKIAWPDAPEEHIIALDNAIKLAEEAAAAAAAADAAGSAATDAQKAGAAADFVASAAQCEVAVFGSLTDPAVRCRRRRRRHRQRDSLRSPDGGPGTCKIRGKRSTCG